MFDPYREWLGVTEPRRPPTLYQLLGLLPGESDPRLIEAAANRQLAKIQQHLVGTHSKEAWRIVDEVTLAKTTLLDPVRRTAYNGAFGIASSVPPAPPRPTAPAPPAVAWHAPEIPAAPTPPAAAPPGWWAAPAAHHSPVPPPAHAPVPSVHPSVGWGAPPAPPTYQVPAYSPPPAPVAPLPIPTPAETPTVENDPASGELPAAVPTRKPINYRSNPALFIAGGGLLALLLIGAAFYVATREGSSNSTGDSKTEVVKASNDPSPDPDPVNTQPEPRKVVVTPPPKKKVPAPPPPKEEPPPKVDPDAEFKQAVVLRGHTSTPLSLAVAPDGRQLISAGSDLAINTWVPSAEKPIRRKTLPNTEPAVGVAFLSGGREAVIASATAVYVTNLSNNTDRKRLVPAGGSVAALAGAPDGTHFLTGSADGFLRWWNAGKDAPEKMADAGGGNSVSCVAVSPDGTLAAAGSMKAGTVSVWALPMATLVKKWKAHDVDVTTIGFSPDSKRLVTAGDDLLVKTWDALSGAPLQTLKGHEDVPLGAVFTPDGSLIATGGNDNTLRYWDAATGEPLRAPLKVEAQIRSLATDPKGRFLIAGMTDGGIQLFFLPQVRPDIPPKSDWVKAPKTPEALPPAPLIESAIKSIRERYAKDYAQTDPEEKIALYQKLLARAKFAPEESAVRAALFREARDMAIKAGKATEAFAVIEARAQWFDGDDLEEKAATLREAAANVSKSIVETAVAVVEEAEKQQRPDILDELLRVNELFPEDVPELAARIQAAKKRWAEAGDDREASRTLANLYNKEPTSPELNLKYGKYLCFRRGDWAEGAPKLQNGDDAALRELGKKEVADPKDAKGQIDLGKSWSEYAPKAEDQYKAGVLSRAKFWYQKGIANLPPAERLPPGQKLTEVLKQLNALGPVTLAKPGEPVTRKHFDSLRNSMAVETQWLLIGSDGYTPEGIVLTGDGSLTSRFRLLDKARVEFAVVPDGRAVKLSAFGQSLEFKPEPPLSILSVQRDKDDVVFKFKTATGTDIDVKHMQLPSPNPFSSPVTLSVSGAGSGDGVKIKSAVVNGPVKPSE